MCEEVVQAIGDIGTVLTGGIVEPNKDWRINAPFSGAQVGADLKAASNIYTGEQMRPEVDKTFSTPFARQLESLGGMLEGAVVGAGVGSAMGGGAAGAGAAGGNAASGSISPYYFGFEPDTLASAGTTEFGQFAGGVPSAGMTGGPAAALAGGSGLNAALGASAGMQAAKMLGGASPLSMPGGGALPPPGGSPGQITPQQRAALMGAMQSEPHRGLAPRFEQRMSGSQEAPGLAALRALSGEG